MVTDTIHDEIDQLLQELYAELSNDLGHIYSNAIMVYIDQIADKLDPQDYAELLDYVLSDGLCDVEDDIADLGEAVLDYILKQREYYQ